MPHLEEIAYDLGRAALADQESLVSGIRSRTGTLIATQALVASFLGGAALDRGPLGPCGWAAIAMLVVGLGMSAIVLAPCIRTSSRRTAGRRSCFRSSPD
jgi:hypothetical protein